MSVMSKKIVIINGSGGVGKDAFVELCGEFTSVKNISSVDKVKEAAKVLVNWNGDKDEKSRKLLVDLKRLSIEYNDYPAKYIEEQAKEFMDNEEQQLMFVHIREIEEIKKIKNLLGAAALLITSNRVAKITSNSSDANVEEYEYDYYIKNDGTLDDLKEQARQFVEDLTK
jgi:hypothetical protein